MIITGNKEKIIIKIFTILIFSLVIFSLWTWIYYIPQKVKLNAAVDDKYEFLDPLRKVVDKKDRLIGFENLREELNKYGQDPNNVISIYFEYLPTGGNISVNKDVAFYPASLVKIPMSIAVMKKIEKEEWKLSNELILMASDKNPGFGQLYKESIGTRFSIENLLKELLINSDNTAHQIFYRNISNDELFKVHEHLGIEDAYNSKGAITVKNFSTFFRSLYMASYLNAENSNYLLKVMSQSSAKEYLSAGLPEDIIFAHKIGVDEEKKIYSDSGIVYINKRPYLLTVAILNKTNQTEGDTKKIMHEISSKVYEYISTQYE